METDLNRLYHTAPRYLQRRQTLVRLNIRSIQVFSKNTNILETWAQAGRSHQTAEERRQRREGKSRPAENISSASLRIGRSREILIPRACSLPSNKALLH